MENAKQIIVDLFAGAGGFSLGFHRAGFETAAMVEIDSDTCQTYANNFPDTAIFNDDIKSLSGQEIRIRSGIYDQEIAGVIGGAPCQGFSVMGKQDASDPRNLLVSEFIRVVAELKPRFFVLENVKNILAPKYQDIIGKLIDSANSSGYNITIPFRVLNASDFGVPQNRERVFIIGIRKDIDYHYYYPKPIASKVTVRDAIADLPNVDLFDELWEEGELIVAQQEWGQRSGYVEHLNEYIAPHINHNCYLLKNSLRTKHSAKVLERWANLQPGKQDKIGRHFYLDWQGQSRTLRAGTGSDRGTFTAVRPIHPDGKRCITVREAARLHSYPDWFQFDKRISKALMQIGNSVPPLMAEAIAKSLVQPPLEVRYAPKVL